MYVKEVTVENQVGLHARPATFFIQKANEYKSSIWVEKEERRVNAKSLLGVLSLGIVGGTTIRIMLTAPMNRLLWMVWSSWSTPASLNNQIFVFAAVTDHPPLSARPCRADKKSLTTLIQKP